MNTLQDNITDLEDVLKHFPEDYKIEVTITPKINEDIPRGYSAVPLTVYGEYTDYKKTVDAINGVANKIITISMP